MGPTPHLPLGILHIQESDCRKIPAFSPLVESSGPLLRKTWNAETQRSPRKAKKKTRISRPATTKLQRPSVDLFGFAGHVVHEEILAEGVGRGEVGFAAAHLGDLLDELDKGIVAGEHEGVDHDAGALALVDFLESLADNEGIEAEGVFVDAAVLQRESGRFSVGDHDDLAHIFFLAKQNALGHSKAFARVGVIRADLNASEF